MNAALSFEVSFYAPNFEKVGRAYCFWLVCLCVCGGGGGGGGGSVGASVNFRTVKARVLKFHMHIPHEKIVDPYFFQVRVMPLF